MKDHDHVTSPGRHDVVHIETDGVVRLHDGASLPVHADLVGGRSHYSVGGEVREGPPWWRGHLQWCQDETEPREGDEIILELDDGRSAAAVIEPEPAGPVHTSAIHGIGPPPFDVP